MNIRIGENEYEGKFLVEYMNDVPGCFEITWNDGQDYVDPDHQGEEGYDHHEDGKQVAADLTIALNELTQNQHTIRIYKEEIAIYKDDFAAIGKRLEVCLKNSRCPECGCGDLNEAESNECGCDAPVCSIECPETLAEAYVRVFNELATLRAENEAFREDHHKHDEWMAWAQSYFNDHPDLCMWGSRLDVGIRETLIQRDNELEQLRAENAELKKTCYLPMPCPKCDRWRLEYIRQDNRVECEKCHASTETMEAAFAEKYPDRMVIKKETPDAKD